MDDKIVLAAEALLEADVLVLITGAGFSADSGLAVYSDVANVDAYRKLGLEYHDICQPHWIVSDPGLFYGFWGQCFNDYRDTQPHEGYNIIQKWRNDKNDRQRVAQEIRDQVEEVAKKSLVFQEDDVDFETEPYEVNGCAGAFFAFTSNVDAHSFDVFEPNEIYECHGNVELWQCHQRRCSSKIWRAPLDHRFIVDMETMVAPCNADPSQAIDAECNPALLEKDNDDTDDTAHVGHTKGSARLHTLLHMQGSTSEEWVCGSEAKNWPTCNKCGGPARPAILMFGDMNWKHNEPQERRFSLWANAVYNLAQERHLKVCIMEVGCGKNVPTCRHQSEVVVEELRQRASDVTLVRINPDFPFADDDEIADHVISIQSRGLEALKQIDSIYSESA